MADSSSPAIRQRKKRKWDQPGEAVAMAAYPVSAMSGMLFGGAGNSTGSGMPNMLASLVGAFPTTTLPMPPVPYSAPCSTVPNNAAVAIVQKINQDLVTKGLIHPVKIHDELIAREIIINDADPGVRYKLTKRQTQEEIQAKTGAVVITRGRFRPPNEPPDSEKPLYLHISAGVQLKDTTECIKSVDAAAALVEEMMKQGLPSAGTVQNGWGGPPLSLVVNVGFFADPSFNLVGRIRGPNDRYLKHIMTETGTEVAVHGKGSGYLESFSGEEAQQPLHLLITGDNFKSLDDAQELADNLLETIHSDSVAFWPSYQAATGGPALDLAPAPSHVLGVSQRPHLAYQQPRVQYPGTMGAQTQGGSFYSSVCAPGPGPWPPVSAMSMAAPALQPPATEKIFMDPYANMLPPTKVYGAVPPPQQLAGGSTTGVTTESSSSIKIEPESRSITEQIPIPVSSPTAPAFVANTPLLHLPIPCSITEGPPQFDTNANCRLQNSNPYNQGCEGLQHPLTNYSGYGGVYPQVSPLQQVALALQRPPPPFSVRSGNGSAVGGLQGADAQGVKPYHGQSGWQVEKQRDGPPQKERRKFQEFPMSVNQTARNDSQVHEATLPSRLEERSLSSSGEKDKNLSKLVEKLMPPPPSRSVLPPPLKTPRPSSPQKEGLKLVEYAEEEDEDSKGEPPSEPSYFNRKPFWAA
ncbi:hypothetical protein BDL97_12G078900 [Sphagnum fallax]|nr:hypothetical protein BDL97_12G078900 [Sphagnum fallax]